MGWSAARLRPRTGGGGPERRPPFDLIVITDPTAPLGVVRGVERCLDGLSAGEAVRLAVQLRAKDASPDQRRRWAEALRRRCAASETLLLVNGDLPLAQLVGADGVQLPEAGPELHQARAQGFGREPEGPVSGSTARRGWLGVSRHDRWGLEEAARGGADFAVLSPVFPVPGKNPALGIGTFETLAREAALPVFALGGIGPDNGAELIRAGAAGLAVQRSVFRAAEPAATVRALLSAIDAGRAGGRSPAETGEEKT